MRHVFAAAAFLIAAGAPSAAPAQSAPSGAASVAAACGGEVQRDAFVKLPRATQFEKLSCFTREAAKRFNATLPNKVDEATTLERVSADGVTLTYHYAVNVLASELRPGALDGFKPSVTAKVCAAADMNMIVSIGGAYRYLWKDRTGKPIGEHLVDRC